MAGWELLLLRAPVVDAAASFFPLFLLFFLFETFFLGLISADKVVSVREAGGFIGSERGTGR
jgi:hypothetical protein